MPLTDTEISNAKPAEKAERMFDGGGLRQRVRLNQRFQPAKKRGFVGFVHVIRIPQSGLPNLLTIIEPYEPFAARRVNRGASIVTQQRYRVALDRLRLQAQQPYRRPEWSRQQRITEDRNLSIGITASNRELEQATVQFGRLVKGAERQAELECQRRQALFEQWCKALRDTTTFEVMPDD